MRLLNDRIQEFIDWMETFTDFGDWNQSVKDRVHLKLIGCMISDPIEPVQLNLPFGPTEEDTNARN